MRKIALLTIIGATLALLAACTKEPNAEVAPSPDKGLRPITFSTSTLEISSRAIIHKMVDYAVAAIITYPEERTFTEERYKYIDGKRVLTTETVISKYGWYFTDTYLYSKDQPLSGNTYYWPEDGSRLNFFAFSSYYLTVGASSEILPQSSSKAGDMYEVSREMIEDLANIDKCFTAEYVVKAMSMAEPNIFAGLYAPANGQDDLLVADPHYDVVYESQQQPEPVHFEFNHTTAKVNISVRLSQELLDEGYEIIDYDGSISAAMSYFYLFPYTSRPDKWVRISDHGGFMCNLHKSYYLLPQATVGEDSCIEHTYSETSYPNYTGNIKIGIDHLSVNYKGNDITEIKPKFTGTVNEFAIRANEVDGNFLQAGYEYDFDLVLNTFNLDVFGNIIFRSDAVMTSEQPTKSSTSTKTTFHQDTK